MKLRGVASLSCINHFPISHSLPSVTDWVDIFICRFTDVLSRDSGSQTLIIITIIISSSNVDGGGAAAGNGT